MFVSLIEIYSVVRLSVCVCVCVCVCLAIRASYNRKVSRRDFWVKCRYNFCVVSCERGVYIGEDEI